MTETDNSSKMSQGMIYIAWLLFLALLTYGFNNFLEQQNNPNQAVSTTWNNATAEVRLKQNRYGHYLTNGKINHFSVTFLVDSGATRVSVPETIADKLKLKKGYPMQSRTANGNITVYDTRLDSISVGGIEIHNIRASINPQMSGNEILLGMSFLKHLEMAQKGKQLILRYQANSLN